MGYMVNHAIVVTYNNPESVKKAHEVACEIFDWVSPISPEVVNGFQSFFIPPDGSKEGWETSDAGDTRRATFISWLKDAYSRGVYLDWAEVQYGDDGHEAEVTDASDWIGREVS